MESPNFVNPNQAGLARPVITHRRIGRTISRTVHIPQRQRRTRMLRHTAAKLIVLYEIVYCQTWQKQSEIYEMVTKNSILPAKREKH